MTRKDFELIAKVLHDSHLEEVDIDALARAFAYRLAQVNANFDRTRFIHACLTGKMR